MVGILRHGTITCIARMHACNALLSLYIHNGDGVCAIKCVVCVRACACVHVRVCVCVCVCVCMCGNMNMS